MGRQTQKQLVKHDQHTQRSHENAPTSRRMEEALGQVQLPFADNPVRVTRLALAMMATGAVARNNRMRRRLRFSKKWP
jgi:hypothetical protein